MKLFNAIKLLRIPFSIFLMPIFWFSLINISDFDWQTALHLFIIIHLFVYPASNGYNSYYDKDEDSIGGLKTPPKVEKNLIYLVYLWDLFSILYAFYISVTFAILIAIYLLVSKAYSYDKIRLKKLPIISTIVVTIFQGSFIYFTIQLALTESIQVLNNPNNIILGTIATIFLIGSYPITQIYQHKEDQSRGDKTLSILLGIKGTLYFASIAFTIATLLLAFVFYSQDKLENLLIYLICGAPILVFFGKWIKQISNNPSKANFENTMMMNKISSISLSISFILMLFFSK